MLSKDFIMISKNFIILLAFVKLKAMPGDSGSKLR